MHKMCVNHMNVANGENEKKQSCDWSLVQRYVCVFHGNVINIFNRMQKVN